MTENASDFSGNLPLLRLFCYFGGMENIGNNIKKYRELKDITREHMASELGMSVSGYSKVERNEVDLTLSRVRKIAEILGISVAQILDFDVSQIFHVSNNGTVQGLGAKADNMHFHGDEFKDKYIKVLEEDNTRLKKLVGEK